MQWQGHSWGQEASNLFAGWLTPLQMFIVSILVSVVLTVVITVILLKVDLGKLAEKYIHKKETQKAEASQEKPNNPKQEGSIEE